MITIVNYGLGNLGSIQNMFKKIGVPSLITSEPAEVRRAEKLVLPGVGAFDEGMKNLAALGLIEPLRERVAAGIPIIGICLGMQLMTARSGEGRMAGFGWLDAETIRFDFDDNPQRLKVPHMGWNEVALCKESRLFQDMYPAPRFYFVHSYHVVCRDRGDVLATARHGHDIVAAFERGNLFGAQFHPEKSHKYGMKLLQNFAGL